MTIAGWADVLHGTDISAFQPGSVPAGDFVLLKATQGTGYVSGELHAQLADARRKKMLVGFYHFPEFGNDPLADARHFGDTVAPLLQQGDKVILDHEAYPSPSAAHASAWGLAWLPYTEHRFQRLPWVYANLDWAINGYCAGMGRYPYWCADPSSPAGQPRVRGPFKSWIAHQYDVSGIDRDVFNGTRADWLGTPQPQQETEMISGNISAGKGTKTGVELAEGGPFHKIKIGWDNTRANPALGTTRQAPAEIRLAMHVPGRKGTSKAITVGAALDDTKGWADSHIEALPSGCDRIDIERSDDGTSLTYCIY